MHSHPLHTNIACNIYILRFSPKKLLYYLCLTSKIHAMLHVKAWNKLQSEISSQWVK